MRKNCASLIVLMVLLLSQTFAEAAPRKIVSATPLTATFMELSTVVLADDGTAWGLRLPDWYLCCWEGQPTLQMEISLYGVWEPLPPLPEGRSFQQLTALDTMAASRNMPIYAVAVATDGTLWQLLPSTSLWYCQAGVGDVNLAAWYPLAPSLPPSE